MPNIRFEAEIRQQKITKLVAAAARCVCNDFKRHILFTNKNYTR